MPPASRRASIASAMARIASADSAPGSAATTGAPRSPCSRSTGSSGTDPRNGIPRSTASSSPPPAPKTSPLMFSITPSSRMFVFCAMAAARDATSCASFCGVVTTTTSARGKSWPSEIDTSPVPGGMSPTSPARQRRPAPQDVLVAFEEEADRHQLQPVLDGRDDHLVDGDGLLVDAEDVWDRVPVDVGVENADAAAEPRERDREVRRQRRLAHTALAARDRD